ncbi:Mitochondrial mRNA pseudouridine synthase Trub2 [Nymphon striatum]|nr:Mitochondrial mRNA pseudouridine synthase Trub2 [Nymphon striatum]
MSSLSISYAPNAWELLNGVFCIYKPSGVSNFRMRMGIVINLLRDLNEMKTRPIKKRVHICGKVSSGKPLSVHIDKNFADHPLVIGPRYQPQDLKMIYAHKLDYQTCGVQVVAVNDCCYKASLMHKARFIRSYHIKGKFGIATDTQFHSGKVLEKSTYEHVNSSSVEQVLSSIEAAHLRQTFAQGSLDIQSQEAYEKASQGIIKPSSKSSPIIYKAKLIEFSKPNFTVEVHCINETEQYLMDLVAEIGLYLKTVATCTQLRSVQYGPFTLSHALLRKNWMLEPILENIGLCNSLVTDEKLKNFIDESNAKTGFKNAVNNS